MDGFFTTDGINAMGYLHRGRAAEAAPSGATAGPPAPPGDADVPHRGFIRVLRFLNQKQRSCTVFSGPASSMKCCQQRESGLWGTLTILRASEP